MTSTLDRPSVRRVIDALAAAGSDAQVIELATTARSARAAAASLACDLGAIVQSLVFTLGGQRFGANVAKVREVIEPLSVAALPQAQPSVLGMFQLRERVIPLIDLQRSLGKPPIADLTVGKIVIMEFNGVRTGFQVDTV